MCPLVPFKSPGELLLAPLTKQFSFSFDFWAGAGPVDVYTIIIGIIIASADSFIFERWRRGSPGKRKVRRRSTAAAESGRTSASRQLDTVIFFQFCFLSFRILRAHNLRRKKVIQKHYSNQADPSRRIAQTLISLSLLCNFFARWKINLENIKWFLSLFPQKETRVSDSLYFNCLFSICWHRIVCAVCTRNDHNR